MKANNWRIFYPLLLGIYPVAQLVGVNIGQMVLLDGLRTFLVAAIFVFVFYSLFCWRIQDEHKAALISVWFFLFFFYYGHVFNVVKGLSVFGMVFGRHRFIIPLWLLVFILGGWLICKNAGNLHFSSRILNLVSIFPLVMSVSQIAVFEWRRDHYVNKNDQETLSSQVGFIAQNTQPPDIYYIILDSYARDDMLLRDYGLDISDFIQQLDDNGFYVPRCSQSNYGGTALSLSSSLNMNYLDQVLPPAVIAQGSAESVTEFYLEMNKTINDSLVRQIFENLGYKMVSFPTDFWLTEWTDADYYIAGGTRPLDVLINFHRITDFEVLFLRTTFLRVFEEASAKWVGPNTTRIETPEKHRADSVLFTLYELGYVPQNIPGPKFVFAHIMSPHSPFVFSPTGGFIVTGSKDPGYPNQVQYLNQRVILLVQSIIAGSGVPPIIILQSDHGLDNEVRLGNFMALYFPNSGSSVLYPNMTPVNIFRLVLNTYFGQTFPLLPDISYRSDSFTTYDPAQDPPYPCDAERD